MNATLYTLDLTTAEYDQLTSASLWGKDGGLLDLAQSEEMTDGGMRLVYTYSTLMDVDGDDLSGSLAVKVDALYDSLVTI